MNFASLISAFLPTHRSNARACGRDVRNVDVCISVLYSCTAHQQRRIIWFAPELVYCGPCNSQLRFLGATRYTPVDPPYVSHAEGLALHTAYIEKFWGSSVSMYDFLVPEYTPVAGKGGREL